MDYQNNPNEQNGEQFAQNSLNNTTAPQQPVYQQPVYQQPTYQQPVYQQPTYQQPVYQQPVYQRPLQPAGNGCATASLVLSILALSFIVLAVLLVSVRNEAAAVFAVMMIVATPILALVGVSLGIPGVILGAKRKARLGVAITGLILSSVTLLGFFVGISELVYTLDRVF